jgi:hypothetical protein
VLGARQREWRRKEGTRHILPSGTCAPQSQLVDGPLSGQSPSTRCCVPFTRLLSFHRFAAIFDSIEQAKSWNYRATTSVKRCFGWKNDPIPHNNDREERNTLADVYVLGYPESEIGVGDIEWCIRISGQKIRRMASSAASS